MSTLPANQQVSVNAGDLDEAIQSAILWASHLRQLGYPAAADRIDAACSRLREALRS